MDYIDPANLPPVPADSSEARRWDETRRRRRMLYGSWRGDLVTRLALSIGDIRREAWGEPDLSSNVFRSSVSALAVLYDRTPTVSHDTPAAAGLVQLVQSAGLWSLLQRVQRDALGMREMLVRVDARERPGGAVELIYRPVFPDLVLAVPNPEAPSEALEVREARIRTNTQTSKARWTWDVWDIRGDARHCILDAEFGSAGADISHEYGLPEGGLTGDAYPCRREDGTPVIPYAMYHAAQTGALWDAYELTELVEGSLTCAVLWTFFGHCIRNASWPQRYLVNVDAGADVEGDTDGTQRRTMVVDPAVVLQLRSGSGDNASQPLVGQWQPGADPEAMQEAVALYERRVAAYAGISPADVQRVAGDPRSGQAIALNHEAQREAQRRYEPVFRPSDERLLAISAVVANAKAQRRLYPEDGYRVAYQALPLSPTEQQSERDEISGLIDLGLLDIVTAFQRLNPGLSRADAERGLDAIAEINARRQAKRAAATKPAPPPFP